MKEMHVQTVTSPSGEEMVLLSKAAFERLREDLRRAELVARMAGEKVAVDAGAIGTYPAGIIDRLSLSGEPPLKVWREHRGFSQAALAEAAEVRTATVSDIERGRSEGSIEVRRALAKALGVTLDLLEPFPDD